MVGCRLCLYQVQVQVEGRDVGRIMVVKVVKAKVVTCRVGQSETRVPRIAAACRVCRVRRRWETCEQSKRIRQLFPSLSLRSVTCVILEKVKCYRAIVERYFVSYLFRVTRELG